jgi:phosphate transport system permease protein
MSSPEKSREVVGGERPGPVRPRVRSPHRAPAAVARLRRRQIEERVFRAAGQVAIAIGLGFVVLLFGSIAVQGSGAFTQTQVRLDVTFDAAALGVSPTASEAELARGDYAALIRNALAARFPEITERKERRELASIVSSGAPFELAEMVARDRSLLGQTRSVWVMADDDVDMIVKGKLERDASSADSVRQRKFAWIDALAADGRVERRFNTQLFSAGDSREPELAGLGGAFMGSVYTLLATLLMSFPLGVATAVYLEEFAPRSRWMDIVEVNINNLAAVPSIVFGLLGLAVFINFFDLPRSSPLVASLVLTLMTLPTVIIASRAAIRSVPSSIRQAALGVGASRVQTVLHHVLPLALPGMLTGTIVGMARALGETAPLLMIGMVAFLVDIPSGVTEPATVLPVQIYLWADSPERAFAERTSAAIIVLLAFLIAMNSLAVILRQRFERRW